VLLGISLAVCAMSAVKSFRAVDACAGIRPFLNTAMGNAARWVFARLTRRQRRDRLSRKPAISIDHRMLDLGCYRV
jgi:hypothetical protein